MASDPEITLAEARTLTRLDPAQVSHLFRVVLWLVPDGSYRPADDDVLAPSDAAMLWFAHILDDVDLGTVEQRGLILADVSRYIAGLDDALAALDLDGDRPAVCAPVHIRDRRYVLHAGRTGDVLDLHEGRPTRRVPPAPIETIVYDVAAIYFQNAGKVVRSRGRARRPPQEGTQ